NLCVRPVSDICEQTGQQRRSDNIDTLTLLGKWQTPEQLQALRAAGRKKPALMETAEELMMSKEPYTPVKLFLTLVVNEPVRRLLFYILKFEPWAWRAALLTVFIHVRPPPA
ncbi:unnamed protein product, partial [Durusdinium trenchii]